MTKKILSRHFGKLSTRSTKTNGGLCWGLRPVAVVHHFCEFHMFIMSCAQDEDYRLILIGRGFKELVPNFAIRDAGSDSDRLPTASTCVNLLKVCVTTTSACTWIDWIYVYQLPRYTNEEVLREKLLQAIYSGAGFDLSWFRGYVFPCTGCCLCR